MILLAVLLIFSMVIQPVASVRAQSEDTSVVDPVVRKKTSLKPKSVMVRLDDILAWDPEKLDNDYINRASVPLKERVRGTAINDYASDKANIMSLAYLIGNNPGKYSSVGDYEFNVNTFDRWAYVGTQVFWDGAVPTPDVIDAAHKNGVPILGTLFFNWSSSYADNQIFAKFIAKDADGKFPAARKLAEIAKHYGFDGYFFNQETTGSETYGKSPDLRDFILEMKAHAESIGHKIIVSWYDAMANGGGRAHHNAVNSSNDIWMKKVDGKIPADEFFMNFNWSQFLVDNTIEHMTSIDRDPFDAYAGLELQRDIGYTTFPRSALVGADNKLEISLGLFIPDTVNGQAETPEKLHDVINKFWTGENRDPSNINDDPAGYNGMARYVVDRTSILEPKFHTSFNTGHGHYWFRNGVKTVTQDWNARSVQDVLPTWTWWIKSDKTQSFDAYYDFEDAYNGGSSVEVFGNIEAWSTQEMMLYSTQFLANTGDYIDITTKGGQGASVKVNVYTDENYTQKVDLKQITDLNPNAWSTTRVPLDLVAGKTVYGISLSFENTNEITDYKFNLGELTIANNETKPATPQNFVIEESAIHTGTQAEAIVKFDRVDNAVRYDIFAVDSQGSEFWLNSSSSNMIYLPQLSRAADSTETTQNLRVYAVAENGEVSGYSQVVFDWHFAATDTTQPKDKARNITPESKVIQGNETAAKLINDTLIDLTDKWWSGNYQDEVVIEFEQPRTVVRWRMEHAGHAGESVNDGLMNTKDFNLEYLDENGTWKVAKEVRNNILHVTDIVLDTPVTAKQWKLNVITRDNGTPWGGIRIYNWKMYETLDMESDNVTMTSAEAVHVKDNLYNIKFNKEKLSRFYGQNMADFTMRIYRDGKATDLIAEAVFDENGYVVFENVQLEGDAGSVFYRVQEAGKDPSNILAVTYEKGEVGPIPELPNPFTGKAKIVSVDAGRKYFSVESIKGIIDVLSANDFTHLHLLLGNDGLRLVLNDMTVNANGSVYNSDDVKAGITAGNQKYADSKGLTENATTALTEAEMNEVFEYAATKEIEIIPSINMPGHMDAILGTMSHLGIENPNYVYNGKTSVTTMDITREDVVNFTTAFAQKYIDYFKTKGVKVFNFGADEYANDAFGNPGWQYLINLNIYDKFVSFANDIAERSLRAGMRPMAFNDGFYYRGAETAQFNDQIIIALWTAGWWGFNVAKSTTFVEKGHDVLNVNDSWYYVLGRESAGGYNRQQALTRMQDPNFKFDNNVGDKVDTIGSMIALWADDPVQAYDSAKFEEWARTFAEQNPTYFNVEVPEPSLPFVNPIVTSDMIIKNPEAWWVYSFEAGNKAGNMIDGNDATHTWWASPENTSGYSKGDYFGLDLGKTYTLGRFRMVMGGASSSDYMTQYQIFTSKDKETWTPYGEIIEQSSQKKITDFVFENVDARYVVVQANVGGDTWVQISEFMVETTELPPVDKAELGQLLETAKALDLKGKTEESIATLTEAIGKATLVFENPDATQEEVDQ
ncbi:MAG: family 20 glycosylhydrolase, partial [Tissierellia bacterium]|nr:family 20 glycosylhydrolase [Tissierellia bacterium]